jgi:hypothetical protein
MSEFVPDAVKAGSVTILKHQSIFYMELAISRIRDLFWSPAQPAFPSQSPLCHNFQTPLHFLSLVNDFKDTFAIMDLS